MILDLLDGLAPIEETLRESLARGPASLALGRIAHLRVSIDPNRPSAKSRRRLRNVPFGPLLHHTTERLSILAPEDWLPARLEDTEERPLDTGDPDVERLLFACAGRLEGDSVHECLLGEPEANTGRRSWLARQVEAIVGPEV